MAKWEFDIEVLPLWREHWNKSKHSYWWWPTILSKALDDRWPNQRDCKKYKHIRSAFYKIQIAQWQSVGLNEWRDVSIEEIKQFLGSFLQMGLVSMSSYHNYWSKSHLYYNNRYVKGKFSSHHIFLQFGWQSLDENDWLANILTIITSFQQNYENNLYTIRDVIFRCVNVMVWQVDFLTIYKE